LEIYLKKSLGGWIITTTRVNYILYKQKNLFTL